MKGNILCSVWKILFDSSPIYRNVSHQFCLFLSRSSGPHVAGSLMTLLFTFHWKIHFPFSWSALLPQSDEFPSPVRFRPPNPPRKILKAQSSIPPHRFPATFSKREVKFAVAELLLNGSGPGIGFFTSWIIRLRFYLFSQLKRKL